MNLALAFSLVLVVALAVLFAWLAGRAWRAKLALIKWPGTFFAGLPALLCTAATGLALTGLYRVYWPAASPAPDVRL